MANQRNKPPREDKKPQEAALVLAVQDTEQMAVILEVDSESSEMAVIPLAEAGHAGDFVFPDIASTLPFIKFLRGAFTALASAPPAYVIQYREGRQGQGESPPKKFSEYAWKMVNGKIHYGYVPHRWVEARLRAELGGFFYTEMVAFPNGENYRIEEPAKNTSGKAPKEVLVSINLCVPVLDTSGHVVYTLRYPSGVIGNPLLTTLAESIQGAISRAISKAGERWFGIGSLVAWDEENFLPEQQQQREDAAAQVQLQSAIAIKAAQAIAQQLIAERKAAAQVQSAAPVTLSQFIQFMQSHGINMPEMKQALGITLADLKTPADFGRATDAIKQYKQVESESESGGADVPQ